MPSSFSGEPSANLLYFLYISAKSDLLLAQSRHSLWHSLNNVSLQSCNYVSRDIQLTTESGPLLSQSY